MKNKKIQIRIAILFTALLFFCVINCPAHDEPLTVPKLTFVTGTNKGEIRYSWTATTSTGIVNYTLLVLKGWHGADEVTAYGSWEAAGADAQSGTFAGEAGEWYSAVLVVASGSDEVFSDVIRTKARHTGAGEFDLRFGVISDVHVGAGDSYPTYQRFEKVLDWYNTEDVTALAIVGDITENGWQSEWNTFKNSWEGHKGKLQLVAVMGNHEIWDIHRYGDNNETINNATDRFEAATGQKTNAHYVINDYHFIVLSAGAGNFTDTGAMGGAIATGRTDTPGTFYGNEIPQSVRDWARIRIELAKADAPGQPIFVFLHWPIRNTFLGSEAGSSTPSFGINPLTGFFKDDPEVIIFGGHHHRPNNDPRSIWQGGFTAVNVPTLNYMGLGSGYLGNSTDGVTNSGRPKIAGQPVGAGQGMIVSVKGSKVIIENYDFDFNEGPQPLGNVVRIPQTWEFDVSQPFDFPYTNARRETQKTAPVFDRTLVTIKNITDTTIEVEFPQAKIPGPNYGNEIVFSYRFDFINRQTGVVERTVRQWSDFMLHPRLQKPTYTQLIGGLTPNTNYELRIYAYGSFQECSTQYLTCIVYSEHPDNFP